MNRGGDDRIAIMGPRLDAFVEETKGEDEKEDGDNDDDRSCWAEHCSPCDLEFGGRPVLLPFERQEQSRGWFKYSALRKILCEPLLV